jgi:elongin-A
MAPRLLSEMIERKMARNIKDLVHIGNLTYDQVAHVLAKVETPAQLRRLEDWSPQLLGEDAELWQRFITRDFPELARQKRWAPKNPLSWSKVYDKYKRENELELKAAEEKMMQGFAAIQAKQQERTSKIVDRHLLPGKGGDKRRPRGQVAPPPKSGVAKFISKARGEAREIAQRRAQAAINGGVLVARPGQIKKAPEMMVNDLKIQAQPDVRSMPAKLPSMRKPPLQEQKDREARLLAAQRKLAAKGDVNFVSDSSDSDVDGSGRETWPSKNAQADAMEDRLRAIKRKREGPARSPKSDTALDDLFGDEQPAKKIKQELSRARKPAVISPASSRNPSSPPPRTRTLGLLSASYKPLTAKTAVRRVKVTTPTPRPSTPPKQSSPSPERQQPSATMPMPSRSAIDIPQGKGVRSGARSASDASTSDVRNNTGLELPITPKLSETEMRKPPRSPPSHSASNPQGLYKRKRPAGIFMPLNKIAKR